MRGGIANAMQASSRIIFLRTRTKAEDGNPIILLFFIALKKKKNTTDNEGPTKAG